MLYKNKYFKKLEKPNSSNFYIIFIKFCHEIIQIVKNIISNAINYKCELIAFESLSIPHKNNKKGKKFNKLVNNNWCRSLFVNNLTKRCNILGIKY